MLPAGGNSPNAQSFGHAGRSDAGYLLLRENLGSNPSRAFGHGVLGQPLIRYAQLARMTYPVIERAGATSVITGSL